MGRRRRAWGGLLAGLTAMIVGCGGPLATVPSHGATRLSAQDANRGPIQLWVLPNDGTQGLLNAINNAKKSIWLEMYILTYTGASQQVADALIAKSRAGVDVRIILENQPFIPTKPGQNPINLNSKAFQVLTNAGVRVKRSSPQFAYTHEKSLVIDGQTAYIMTMNLSNTAMTANREYIAVDQDPTDVQEVAQVFDSDWSETPYTPHDPNLVVSPTDSRSHLLALIDQAQKTLTLESEFLDDPEIVGHLATAQTQRQVAVQVMLSYQKPDPQLGDTNAKEKAQLAAAGITNVRFIKSITLHAKAILVDGARAYIGSENMTTNSLDKNREMGVLLDDPTNVGRLVQVAAKDWQAD